MMRTTLSMAGTGKTYIKGQIRFRDDEDKAHIQIPMDYKGNRDYGYAFSFNVPTKVRDWLRNEEKIQTNKLESLAESGAEYIEMQVTPYSGGKLHIQIPGREFNRDYGCAGNIDLNVDLGDMLN